MAQSVKNLPAMWKMQAQSLGWEHPLEEGTHSIQYSCLENPHRQRSLVGYSPRGHKELDTTEQLKHKVKDEDAHLGKDRKKSLAICCLWASQVVHSKKKNTPAKEETRVQSLRWEDPLEKKKRSCILDWEIPWTEKPDGLQSVGSQIVRHNLATEQQQLTFKHHCLESQILLYFVSITKYNS